MIKTYSELMELPTFSERLLYLKLNGCVAHETFGYDRYMNQIFYTSQRWRRLRRDLILRDNGCDLADPTLPIPGAIYIHHMNPLRVEDIENETEYLMNPEFLICCSFSTHNLIHYGSADEFVKPWSERKPGDTTLW